MSTSSVSWPGILAIESAWSSAMRTSPRIVDVKRHSLSDGPGIRSVVFFKGCPLQCSFCQNPETQNSDAELVFYPADCIGCGCCAEVCTQDAVDLDTPGHIIRERCDKCGKCADACPGTGLRLIGSFYSVHDLVEVLLRDRAFYHHSGGGVTLSGGECTLYPEYVEALLIELRANGIHTALQTSGYFHYEIFVEKILPNVDLIFYDIKIADPECHKLYTGKSNERILNNLRRLLSESTVEVHPRIPVIPGITTTRENITAIVDFLCEVGARDVSLVPYNPLGIQMSARLGREKPPLPERFMKIEEEKEIAALLEDVIAEHGGSR